MKSRIFHYSTLLISIIIINFFIPRLLPGSPVGSLLGDDPGSMTSLEKMDILKSYDLDKGLWEQFFNYLKNLFSFNWGNSFSKKQPIVDLVKKSAGWTLLLSLSSLLISSILGTILGAISATTRKSHYGLSLIALSTFVSSLPSFLIAIFMIAIFSVKMEWFPLYGAYSMWANYEGISFVVDVMWHMALPLFVMVIGSLLVFMTTARFSTISVLKEEYIRIAKIRGLSEKTVYFKYIIRNALIPVFTIFMMDIGYILSGSFIIETVFSYPGLGMLMHNAVSARDYPLIQYTFLTSSFVTITALALTDILYKKIDPRVGDY